MDTAKPVRFSQRALSWLIITLLVWQPVAPSFAAAITPTGPATMDKAANGVPVVNITTPNAAGISHNQFKDYNVGKEGLILNNATGQLTQTQLGGLIQNNPNLRAGQEARGIINEVTGGSRSQLQGYTEVAGRAANVMVANPYGITCNGCGFINTPNATLTTGKPQFDAAGNLAALDVTKGTITVEGKGLDASASDALSLISRATEVNAAIHAKDLTVTAGANRVDANGKATAITEEGKAPSVAVDTGALGGMYANRIHLVSSEKGVGVNLGNLTARQGDIRLDASGKMVISDSVASGSLTAKGEGVTLNGSHKAGGDIALASAQDLALNNATLAADGKLTLNGSGNTQLNGSSLTSGGDMALTGAQLTSDSASQVNAARNVSLTAQRINQQGKLISGGDTRITADRLDNQGSVAAKGKLTATTATLANSGTLQGQTLAVRGDSIQNSGTLASDGTLHVDAGALTTGADSVITGKTDVILTTQAAADLDGQVNADKALSVNAGELQTRRNAHLQSGSDMTLTAAGNATLDGTQAAKGALDATAKQLNHGGKSNARTITLNGPESITNSGTLVADTLNLSSDRITNGGLLQGTRALNLQTDWLDNLSGGTLYSAQDLTLSIPGLNNDGLITTDGDLHLHGDRLINGGEINGVSLFSDYGSLASCGRLLADDALSLKADSINTSGVVAAKNTTITAKTLNNKGSVQGDEALALDVQTTANDGTLAAGGTLNLNGQTLDNSGNLRATSLLLTLGQKLNNASKGGVAADNLLTLNAPQLLNAGLIAAKNLELNNAGISNSGILQGTDLLAATGTQLTNQQGGLLLSNGNITLKNDSLDNAGQIQGNTLNLATGQWVNTGVALGENGLDATVNGTLDNQGKIVSQQALTVQADATDNSGTLMAKVLALHGDLQSSGLIQGADSLAWNGATLANSANGQLISGGNLALQGQTLNNDGRMQGRTLTASADNWRNGGTVQAQEKLSVVSGSTLDNQGQMLSQGLADIRTAQLTNNGKLAAKDLTISAPDITNNGTLQGNNSLSLTTRTLFNGNNGQLASGGTLDLNLDSLENQGLLYVEDGLSLNARKLFNGGSLEAGALDITLGNTLTNSGTLLAHNAATLHADQIGNSGQIAANTVSLTGNTLRNSGLIQGAQQAQATADSITNTTSGSWLSGGALTLDGRLDNAGTVQGDTVALTGTALDNAGVINGLHGLSGTYSGDISNSGQFISGGVTEFKADSIRNSGRITGDTLALNAATLNNDGLWQGTNGLTLNADKHTTGAGSRTLSGGDFTVNAGQLSTDGTLQGGRVTVTADDWRLGGTLLSEGGLTAGVAGTLALPGTLTSQEAMNVRAQTLNNDGELLSAGDITLRGQQLTNNGSIQGKTLAAHEAQITNNGTLTGLDSLTLDNRQASATLMARMAMATPQLALINGAKGSLLTQGTLDITAGAVSNAGLWQGNNILLAAQSLDNSGAIQSAGGLNLALAGNLNSTAGSKITAMGTAALNALVLTNDGQWAAKNLTLNADTLANGGTISGSDGLTATLSGAVNQQAGATLASNGALNLSAASVDNAGKLQGADLTVSAATLTNRSGAEAVSAGALTLTTPSLFNYGLIQGAGETRIDATAQAMNAGKMLSGTRLTLTSPQYSGAGWLQATNLILNAANNAGSGTLLADQMTLTGDTFINKGTTQAGSLALNYRQLTNNGTLLGKNQLTVNATQVDQSASGKLFSGGDLFVGATGMNALGQVVALGNLTLKLANAFSGKSQLAAGKTLNITSNGAIDNQSVMQGQAVNLSAGGQLTNTGKITTGSGASTLSGSNIVLNGNSSLQGGGDVTLASRSNITANGFAGTLGSLTLSAPGSIVNTALLYAANNLALYANSITNQRGDMLAGNNLWLQRDAAGNANSEVINTSGNIETRNGDISVKTGHLLNTRDGLTVATTQSNNESTPPAYLDVLISSIDKEKLKYAEIRECHETGGGSDGGHEVCTSRYVFGFTHKTDVKDFILNQTEVIVSASGGSALISAAKNINIQAAVLDNRVSNILAGKNINLSGSQLNNESIQAGKTTTILKYQAGCTSNCYTGPYQAFPANKSVQSVLDKIKRPNAFFRYKPLNGPVTTLENGELYRSVIQAGGNVAANFTSNISNTTTTSNAGRVSSTISTPSLNTLSNQSIGGSVAKQALTNSPVAVNSPQWQDQLQNALQQINGGGALDNSNVSGAALSHINGQQKGSASLGNTGSLANAGVTNAVLKNTGNGAPGQYQGKSVDTSAYPLPSGNNGYFVVSENPKSPYLITVNPKLDGLGQLDPALFGDLNKLLGISPPAAPRETNSAYTDEKQFLGSSYMLDRIKLNPDYDYRFLGDAAFDTRYVSNALLNQTGNRYLNGIGSDLAQMQYLMDNAASAQQSLGLQFGVSLTAEQIAALDHSILWWESATINGETVLIPKLYLSPKDVTVNNGSVIAGNNISLEGGNVTNSGSTLLARNDLSVNSAGQITNSNDALLKAGGKVDLSAIGDISNISSTISGKIVALDSLDGSINNVTLADQYSLDAKGRNDSINLKDTTLGSIADITALDGLSLAAGKDITLTGATLNAGGDLLMDAGGNIAVNAIAKNDAFGQSGFGRKTATSDADVSWQGSAISAGGNLAMLAGNDLTLSASDVSVGKNAQLSAGNDLNLNAQQTSHNSRNGDSESHSTGLERTTVSAGGNLTMLAGNDLTLSASDVSAGKNAQLSAGNDLNLNAQQTSHNSRNGNNESHSSGFDRSDVNAGQNLTLTAGQDINSQAAGLTAKERVAMQAGRDINLLAEEMSQGDSARAKKQTVINEHVRQQGTEIDSGTDTVIVAGRDMYAEAAQVLAKGDVGVSAGRDLTLTTATESDYSYFEKIKTKKGFLKKKTTHTIQENSQTNEKGTLLSGDNVSLNAGNNLLVKGSAVAAEGDIALKAANDATIEAATEESSHYSMKKTKKSGVFGGGLGITVGSQSTKASRQGSEVAQSDARSVIGTTGGNVIISAGNQATLSAADVVAGREQGDTARKTGHIDITASDISIIPGKDIVQETVKQSSKSSGLGISLSNPIIDAVQNVRDIIRMGGSGITQGKTLAGEAAATFADIGNGTSLPVNYGRSSTKSESNYYAEFSTGSNLTAAGNVQLNATGGKTPGDVLISGSRLGAGEAVIIDAKNNVDITTSTDKEVLTTRDSSSSWNITSAMPTIGSAIRTVSGGPNHGAGILPFGMERAGSKGDRETTAQTGSQISGTDIYITSQNGHVNLSGSALASINDLLLSAKNGDINVTTGNNSVYDKHSGKETFVGSLGGDGYSGKVGYSSSKHASMLDRNQQSTLRSQISSQQGNVALQAKNDISVNGGDISAGKSLELSGENIRLDVSEDRLHTRNESSSTQYAATAYASGWAVTAAQALESAARSQEEGRDPRLTAIYAAQAGLTTAANVAQQAFNSSMIRVGVGVSAGSSKEQQDYRNQQQQGSTLAAGESVILKANQDIEGQGVNIAGKNVLLSAGRDINLTAALDTEKEKSNSSGNQYSLGVSFSLIGQQNGFSVDVGASQSRSKGNGSSLVNHNSRVHADETLNVNSGRDTTLQGAELHGDRVVADVGRNLTISSQQDTAKYDSKSSSSGVNISICVPPICAGSTVQGSANFSSGKLHNDYRSVIDQSGIFAGAGGFDINVGSHTQLDGAVIASDAEAAKNRLSTDTLGWSDIRNKAESGGSQFGLNVSGGVAQNSQSGGYQATTGETAKEGQSGGYKGTPGGLPSASLAHVSESDSSTTHSAVAAGDIIIRDPAKQQQNVADLSRDTANAHKALDNNFDKEAIKDKLEIQQQATALGTQAMTVYMDSKLDAAKKQVRDDMAARGELNGLSETEIESKVTASPEFKAVDKEYGIGSPFWTASSAMTGLVAGVLGGNVQGGMAAGAAPVLAKLVKDAAGKNEAARIALHTVVSAALAKAQGGNATAGAIGGFVASAGAERFAGALYGKKADELTPDEKMVVLNLVAAVGAAGGGVAAGDTGGMVSAGNAARVEVENNSLSDLTESVSQGKTPQQVAKERVEAENERYKQQNCAGMSAEACSVKMYTQRQAELKDILLTGADFMPVAGDIKSFAEAQSAYDYLIAVIGVFPPAKGAKALLKGVEVALKKGDVAEASKLLNKASDEISGYLPGPGKISVPTSGVGASAKFSITNAQVGKKLGKHVQDFGGNASNAADRERVLNIINDIGSNPDKVVAGKFAGQGAGAGASRGDVFFRIKGNDVVVTKPDGSFVTILKDGVLHNTSVKNALKGAPQ